MIIIVGPTGVGKTELSLKLAAQLKNPAIINADLGQLYTPLTIGTAKPDWRNEPVPHYLFDILEQPENFTAFNYRRAVIELFKKLNAPNNSKIITDSCARALKIVPILVGGSGFYLQALFFKSPLDDILTSKSDNNVSNYDNNASQRKNLSSVSALNTTSMLWQKLNLIDPVRAQEIDSHDLYRIQRALEIWQIYKILPSNAKPVYAPIVPEDQKVKIIILTRDLPELYARIDQRVLEMLSSGWLAEVQSLVNTPWEKFLLEKRLIGYDDLLISLKLAGKQNRIEELLNPEHLAPDLISLIQQRSRNYAKRQIAFFKMLARKLTAESAGQIEIEWLNLTATDVDLYIKRLLSDPSFEK